MHLEFGWPSGEALRVITEWEVDVVGPDGARTGSSGVVRERWQLQRESAGWALTGAEATVVRRGSRQDDVAVGVTRWLAEPWVVRLAADLSVPPATSRPASAEEVAPPSPAEAGPASEADPTPDADGAPPPAEPPAPQPVAWTPLDAAGLVGLVVDDRDRRIERLFATFHGQDVPLSRDQRSNAGLVSPGTGEVDVAEVVRRVEPLVRCPHGGPGSRCVELELVRAYQGADPRAAVLDVGQRRVVERWTVHPDTLVPEAATFVVDEVRRDADGGRWTYRGTRRLTFLPSSDPTPPDAERAPAR